MTTNKQHLDALRAELNARGLDGFVVPLTDEHMSEYVAPYAKRLAWLTGFLGSAGSAIVLENEAAIFIDGRYTIQVRDQVDEALFAYTSYPETTHADWLQKHAAPGAKIGFDPWLHDVKWVANVKKTMERKGGSLIAQDSNPIDAVWADQPVRPTSKFKAHDVSHAGQSHEDKLDLIAAAIEEAGADYTVLAALDSVAWAFNIRANDIENTPVGLAFAVVGKDGKAQLFTDLAKTDDQLVAHLGPRVTLQSRDVFDVELKKIGGSGACVLLDPRNTVAAIFAGLKNAGAAVIEGRDPVVLPKACKNEVELEGSRAAHKRDGAAVSEFLNWLSKEAPKGTLTEIDAAKYLEGRRRTRNSYQDNSFRTISAACEHAAIPHYSVDEDSNLTIAPNSVFLVDSGGQYLDGTTDITRTVAVGSVSEEAKRRFTLVLKGHIAVAQARFPEGTPGGAIDTLARHALWQAGLDFDHGTGHGVGSYLSVHEGPQRIAKRGSDEPLKAGMILSNEPGYYKAGEYGIRIENLVICREDPQDGDERKMLCFETITFAPIDRNMIVVDMLNDEERGWLNRYHARVREVLVPQLSGDDAIWVENATAPL